MGLEVLVQADRQVEPCGPQPRPATEQARAAAAGEREPPAAPGGRERQRPRAGRDAQLDRPQVLVRVGARERRGQVQPQRPAAGRDGVERRRQRARGVDHEQVARVEQPRQVADDGVRERAVGAADEQPHQVARDAPPLGRGGGLGQRDGTHAAASDRLSSRAR